MSPHAKRPLIEVGYQTYVSDGTDPFGAVREVAPVGRPEFVINVEGAGDCNVHLIAVAAVHHGKVVFVSDQLDTGLPAAIRHAHEREDYPPP